MGSGFNMPYQKERENDEKKGVTSKKIYKPLPVSAGQVVANDVIVPLFSPNNWKLFNPTPEDARRYGLAGGGGLVSLSAADPLVTFYFRLLSHSIDKFSHPDGRVGYGQVVCPIEMNKYLVGLGKGPMFDQPRCAFCEEEQRMWDYYNSLWEARGVDKKSLSKDGYKDFMNRNPEFSGARDQARKFQADARFIVSIFDHAKNIGVRPKDEGETSVEHQIWFAPKAIFDGLVAVYEAGGENGFRFFEPNAQGMPIIAVTKNTQDCKQGDMRNTKYAVSFVGKHYAYDPNWLSYILNPATMVDPSEFVHLIDYEAARFYVTNMRESSYSGAHPAPAPSQTTYSMPQPPSPPQGMPQAAPPPPQPPGMPQGMPQAAPPPPPPPQGVPPMSAPLTPAAVSGYPQMQMPPGMPPMSMPQGMPPSMGVPQGMPPMGAPPAGMPPSAMPPGPPIPMQAPIQPPTPMTSPVQIVTPPGTPPPGGAPPDRTPPAGEDPPGKRRSW
jgi:hypothetical protein